MSDNIDDLDLKIVLQLQENGRATITELAEKVGSSRPTVTNRLKRLIDEGLVIVTGGLNMSKFGYKMACIGLEVKSSETRVELEECLTHCPRVINMFRTTGKANLHIALWGEDDRALNSRKMAGRFPARRNAWIVKGTRTCGARGARSRLATGTPCSSEGFGSPVGLDVAAGSVLDYYI